MRFFYFNLKLVCTKAETALAEEARAISAFLKNSLVQINSKLNLKPYDYLISIQIDLIPTSFSPHSVPLTSEEVPSKSKYKYI